MTLFLLATLACVTDAIGPGGADSDTPTSGTKTEDTGPTADPDDTGGPDDTDPTGSTGDGSDIVGDWVSEGSNISPLLAPYYDRVIGEFYADGTYSAEATRTNGTLDVLTGTYTVDLSTTPHGITLLQATPSVVESQGIWQVSGDTLTYEVVQVEPNPYNYVPPTPSAGFGSSSGGSLEAGDNVQIFVRI